MVALYTLILLALPGLADACSREWYSYHFPELVKIVADNYMYARVAGYIKARKDLSEERLEGLEDIVMDSAKVKAISDASKSSMG